MIANNKIINTDENINEEMLENTKERIIELSQRLKKTDKPVFIELTGTPKSGKTTLKRALEESLSKYGIDVYTRRETAEYNPINKSDEHYDIWMILELFKNISEDLSKKNGQVIIYDRGILDRIPWMKLGVEKESLTKSDFKKLTSLYSMKKFDGYSPITKIFETSPKLSVQRQGKPGFFVNEKNVGMYNEFLKESLSQIQHHSSYSSYTITDVYQGNMKSFIIDNTNDIIDGINKELDRRATIEKAEDRQLEF